MEHFFNYLLDSIGLESSALMGVLALFSLIMRFIGKSIPDDATGALGIIRKIAKILGLYVSNRLTSTESTATAARRVI